jgi:hypothetical protein
MSARERRETRKRQQSRILALARAYYGCDVELVLAIREVSIAELGHADDPLIQIVATTEDEALDGVEVALLAMARKRLPVNAAGFLVPCEYRG